MPKPKIYESPDGGKTVYVRDFGSPTRVMMPGSIEDKLKSLVKSNEERQWRDIIKAAETDPDLRELLDQAIMLYQLKRDSEETHA